MPTTQTATFLFCDLVESTELFARLGHERADAVRRECYATLRSAVVTHVGTEIKATGDGLFVVFPSGADALDGAVAMQQSIVRLDRRTPDADLALRVGISVGDAIEEDGDWHGVPVVEAARLCAAAQAGEVLVAEPVRVLFGSRRPHSFGPMGTLPLKGLGDRHVALLQWDVDEVVPPLPRPLVAPAGSFFVGRDHELDRISALYEQAASGEGPRMVLLGGEPGAGKTRLAAEAAARANRDGATVLFGRCDEGVGMPYQPFVEALAPHLESMRVTITPTLARSLSEVSRVIPTVTTWFGGLPPPTPADPETHRYLLFDAVSHLMATVAAEAPVVLVLDDLQWATRPTLLLIRHLIRSSTAARILVLATYRDTELPRDHPLTELLADLRIVDGVVRLSVSGLDVDGASAFIAAMAGHELDEESATLAGVLVDATRGNPLFLREVLIHLAETGAIVQDDDRHWHVAAGLTPATIGVPAGVREVIGRRAGRLSDAANRALTIGSVVGPTFSLELLEAIPDADGPTGLLDSLDEATRAGLLVETQDGYAFTHALVRQSLYEELSAARRARLHRSVGEALEAHDNPGRHLEELAYHFGESVFDADVLKAVDYALLAAERALDQTAEEAALEHAEHAMELLDRVTVANDSRRARACALLAEAYGEPRYLDAKAAALRGVEHARRAGSAHDLARCAAVYARMNPTGQADANVETLIDEALAVLPEEDNIRALVLAERAMYRAVAAGDNAGALPPARDAVRLARGAPNVDVLRWALQSNLQALCGGPDVEEQQRIVTELEALRGRPVPTRGFYGFEVAAFRARACLELGDLAGFDRATDDVALLPSRTGRSNTANLRAVRALIDGRLDDAQREADAMLAYKTDMDTLNVYAGLLFFIARESGRISDFLPMLEEAVRENPGIPAFQCALTVALCDTGRVDDAQEQFAGLVRDYAKLPRDYTWMGSITLLAEACAELDEVAIAPVLYDELLSHSGHIVVVANIVSTGAAVDRYLGMLAAVLGRQNDAEEHYCAALDLETRLPAPAQAAHTQEWQQRLERSVV